MKKIELVGYIIRTFIYKLRYYSSFRSEGIARINRHAVVDIKSQGKISVGYRFQLLRNSTLLADGGNIMIGGNVFFNQNCIIVSRQNIEIGSGCSFGPNVCIYDHDHKFDDKGFKKGEFKKANVTIGKNCWIGAGTTILRGTHIGDGCVIGAGTLIHGEIPPYSLVTDNRDINVQNLRSEI